MLSKSCVKILITEVILVVVEIPKDEVELSIKRVEEFCTQHNWEVVYTNNKIDESRNTTITLYRKRKPEILFYIFLHEVGHVWLQQCDFTYQDKYPELCREAPRYATMTYKIARIQEEIEAWEVGKNLARSLGLRINQSKFEKLRAHCLTTYMNWAGKPRKNKMVNNSNVTLTTTTNNNTCSSQR